MDRRLLSLAIVTVAVVAGVGALVLLARDDETRPAVAYAPVIDPSRFTTEIDNAYLPLRPGTKWEYSGTGGDGEVERTVVEVTRDARMVMGVTCVVVRDEVTVDGHLVELTYDWFAQDAEGNVWYFGEDTAEYEQGRIVNHDGAWEAGVDGAQPGIVMPAGPRVGDSYRQEYYAGEAEDHGEVVRLDERVAVPFGTFDNVLMTRDFTPLEPGVVEHKFYARGVGLVREMKAEGGAGRSDLVLMTTS